MSTSKQPVGNGIKKQEDSDQHDQPGPSLSNKDDRKEIKPAKTLNRVPREFIFLSIHSVLLSNLILTSQAHV